MRQKFTSKERDAETGLDYFLARYYSARQGRFTSPDEFAGGPEELFDFTDDASDNPTLYADLDNPQSLNKYQYCYNDPLNHVDPDGHIVWKLAKWAVKAYRKGSVKAGVAEDIQDVRTVLSRNSTAGERVEAAISVLSPVSVRDGKAAYRSAKSFFRRSDDAKTIVNKGGSFGDLDSARKQLKEADAVAHHMPQAAAKVTSRNDGPAVGMTKADHAKTRTYAGRGNRTKREDARLTPRQRLAKDTRDLRRNFGSKYRRGSLEAINYARTRPEFQKPPREQR